MITTEENAVNSVSYSGPHEVNRSRSCREPEGKKVCEGRR
jgi:hypothetical protein